MADSEALTGSLRDITPQLHAIGELAQLHGSLSAPPALQDALNFVLAYFSESGTVHWHHSPPSTIPSRPVPTPQPEIRRNIKINGRTTLDIVYTYESGTLVEYPETSKSGSIGHLFRMEPGSTWFNPARNFVYSQGEPHRSTGRKGVFCDILVDSNRTKVACKESHSTCQGSKVCPQSDIENLTQPHLTVSRDDITDRLHREQLNREKHSSTRSALFKKTLAYFAALSKQGCGAPPHEATIYLSAELEQRESWLLQQEKIRRGHLSKPTCDGRLLFQYDNLGKAFIRCEHYDRKRNIDHLIDWDAGRGLYDTQYLEALFSGDPDSVADFEEDGLAISDTGPLH
ncbi:hypothetical protein B0H10DRAFT_1943119 [Mycena sp. CBHHK59/15]|nr:hypothetical protein B0H10DRAFT_1943119 [Mycena sp. CBHHK59/15]